MSDRDNRSTGSSNTRDTHDTDNSNPNWHDSPPFSVTLSIERTRLVGDHYYILDRTQQTIECSTMGEADHCFKHLSESCNDELVEMRNTLQTTTTGTTTGLTGTHGTRR